MWRVATVCLHMYGRERIINAVIDLLAGKPQVLRPKGNVLLHDRRDQLIVRVLEDHTCRLADVQKVSLVRRIHPRNDHLALCRQVERIDELGKGRFAAAVPPKDCDKFALCHLNVHAVQGEGIVAVLRHIGKFQLAGIYHCLHSSYFSLFNKTRL